jgi:hypothetical protein
MSGYLKVPEAAIHAGGPRQLFKKMAPSGTNRGLEHRYSVPRAPISTVGLIKIRGDLSKETGVLYRRPKFPRSTPQVVPL